MEHFPNQPSGWLRKGLEDLHAGERLLQPPALPMAACFHAQQAAEKSLKGVLSFLGLARIPRTHSPLELADLVAAQGVSPPLSDEQWALFAPYAVQVRYDELPGPSAEAALHALTLARDVYQWAERLINQK